MGCRTRWVAVILPVCLLCLSGCSRRQAAVTSARPVPATALELGPDLASLPGNTFQVTYSDRVVRMEREDFRKSIRSVSTDNTTLVFDPSDAAAARLTQGSILFIPGFAVRKVAVVTKQDGNIVVVTEDPTLPEVIKDGKIQWTAPIKFAQVRQQQRASVAIPRDSSRFQRLASSLQPTVYAAGGLSGETDGWKYNLAANPQPDKLNLELMVSREYNGVVITVNGSGYVQNFETAATMLVQDSSLKYFDFKNTNLNGMVNFGWQAAKNEKGVEAAEQRIKLPSSFSIPMPIGGLPFSLEVSEALLIHPAFTGGGEVARGRFRVEYNGVQGFSFKEGNVEQDGQAGGDGSIVDNFSLAPIAPVGFVAAVAMPRIELKLGTDTVFQVVKQFVPSTVADAALNLVKSSPLGKFLNDTVSDKLKTTGAAYAQLVISTSTIAAGAGSLIPCQKAMLISTISVGANATLLGKDKGKVSKDVFRQEKKIVVPPTKSCDV
ncbi:MAG TPA: hypothetical protein VL177_08975 [Terriglobales bacterium]|nr:hypothetical protein [Terriglobales bacterium]